MVRARGRLGSKAKQNKTSPIPFFVLSALGGAGGGGHTLGIPGALGYDFPDGWSGVG